MNNITSNYYIGLMEQCEIEQDIFESMLQYDYKLASLGSVNESTISDIDAKYLTEASEGIFKKMLDGVLFVIRKIKEFFINIGKWIKGLFTKNKDKNKIIEQQVKEAENVAKQDKVIIDVEVVKDNLQDKSEEEISDIGKQVMEDINARHQAYHKYMKDAVDQINANNKKADEEIDDYIDGIKNLRKELNDLMKSLDETTYTTDNGQKRKGVIVDKEVAKKIVPNKNQYNEAIGPKELMANLILPDRKSTNNIPGSIFSRFDLDFRRLGEMVQDGTKDLLISMYDDIEKDDDLVTDYTKNKLLIEYIFTYYDGWGINSKDLKTQEGLNKAIRRSIYGSNDKNEEIKVRDLNGYIQWVQNDMDRLVSFQNSIIKKLNLYEKVDHVDLMTNKHWTTDHVDAMKKLLSTTQQYLNIIYKPTLLTMQQCIQHMQNAAQQATHNVIIQPSQNEE